MSVAEAGERFTKEVCKLAAAASTTEETYYPALRDLCASLLEERRLPFQVRVSTSEHRPTIGGTDRPDLAFYDRADFVAVLGEVKLPSAEVDDLAVSTERDDQVGRYLSRTGVVLLFTVRAVGLLACRPGFERRPGRAVPSTERELLDVVELWPSESALRKGNVPTGPLLEAVADLLERAVTEFAPIASPASLALILARQARRARADLPDQFDTVSSLLDDYRSALGLSFTEARGQEFFRSSLIQTAYYALFAGWTLWHRTAPPERFRWEEIDRYLKIPFLGKLFFEFRHPDRLAELGLAKHLDRATETLNRVDRAAFFAGFSYGSYREPDGNGAESTSAITYFYEPFLEAFDPELRKEVGVWYTPPEVVRYQVRKADGLLRERLGCRRGFADPNVVVLDPCCGTGAYLLEVIQCIAEELLSRGDEALLAAELLEAVSHRIIGFELLTAPFVIAQLQVYMLLDDLGVPPTAAHRPAVYLTNALTGWNETDQIRLNFPELQQEHEAARTVKRGAPILVVLGNPPYNRFAGTALDEEADLVDHYKGIERVPKRDRNGRVVVGADGRPELKQEGESRLYTLWGVRKQLLDDLYIRFFRLAEQRIGEVARRGVVSFISNASFLMGRSHPIMRESLLANFDEVWVDNLNGDKYKTGKVVPQGLPGAGTADQSVFTTDRDPRGIQVGTSITTWLKVAPEGTDEKRVWYRDFWGKAKDKRRALTASLAGGTSVEHRGDRPEGPREYEAIRPTTESRWMLCRGTTNLGYESWPSLDELFPTSYQGVNPNRGLQGSLVDMSRDALARRMRDYYGDADDEAIVSLHPELMTKRARYTPETVRALLRKRTAFDDRSIVPYLVFPLDERWIYYETEAKLLNERRPEFWENLANNEFLITVPQPRQVSESLPLISRTLVDLHVHDRGSVCFPLWTRSGAGLYASEGPNLAASAQATLKATWGTQDSEHYDGRAMVARLFRASLAVMHAPQYQRDHGEALGSDWARIPIPRNHAEFLRLVALGDRVATLLDAGSDPEDVVKAVLGDRTSRMMGVVRKVGGGAVAQEDLSVDVSYFGSAAGRWIPRAPTDDESWPSALTGMTGDLYLNERVYVANVPAAVWAYEIGGYPVIKKWLGYRQRSRLGRSLELAEARHMRSVVQRLAAILVLAGELDREYEMAAADGFTTDELGLRR